MARIIFGNFLLIISFLSCGNKANERIYIEGNLNGLPDGTAYLLNEKRTVIDCVFTSKGRFVFDIPSAKFNKHGVTYASFEHLDKSGKKRMFNFPSRQRFNNAPLRLQFLRCRVSITSQAMCHVAM